MSVPRKKGDHRCIFYNKNGLRCLNRSVKGLNLCYSHGKLNQFSENGGLTGRATDNVHQIPNKKLVTRCMKVMKDGKRCKNKIILLDKNGNKTCDNGSCHKIYCKIHLLKLNSSRPEKPEECPICFESLENQNTPLECGHWIHLNCIRQQFKAECPICRHPLKIRVYGTVPEPNIEHELNDSDTYYYYEENILYQEEERDHTESESEEHQINDRENDFILARILSDEDNSERLLNDPLSPLYAIPVGNK